jgi:hypothetical protein
MYIGNDILKVPPEIQIDHKLQSYGMNRRSEEIEEAIYRDFVASVTVTSEVLAVLVRMPELASIVQAKEYLRESREASHEASSELRGRGGLRSVANRFWRHVVVLLSLDAFRKPQSRYPGIN